MHGELRRKALLGYITSTTIPEHPKQNLVTYMEEFQSCYREYNELAPNSAAKMTPEAFVDFLYCYCHYYRVSKRFRKRIIGTSTETVRIQNGSTQSIITPSLSRQMRIDSIRDLLQRR